MKEHYYLFCGYVFNTFYEAFILCNIIHFKKYAWVFKNFRCKYINAPPEYARYISNDQLRGIRPVIAQSTGQMGYKLRL